jgi:hypothetical protein
MKFANSVNVRVFVLFLFAFAACAVPGSYVRSTVNGVEKTYRYDEGGKKVLVYEVDRTGKLTVHDPNDKQAKMMMSGRKWEEKQEAAQVVRLEKIRQAPKRRPNDPIFVNFMPIDDSEINMNEKQKKDMYDYFRKQLANDPVIRLNEETGGSGKHKTGKVLKGIVTSALSTDVDLKIKVTSKTVYGTINGKLAEAKEMAFQASINSRWLKDKHTAEDAGTLFEIPRATQRLSQKIKKIIKDDIGPTIPADRSL